MGHTRLGEVPETRKWNEIVRQVAGSGLARDLSAAPTNIGAIAAQTLDAAQKGLDRAAKDAGVRYTFYLLAQIAVASRADNWARLLAQHGIHLSDNSTVFDFTAPVEEGDEGPGITSTITGQNAGQN